MTLLGVFGSPPPVKAQTMNVCLEGLSIGLQEIESALTLTSYLVLDKKEVALEIKIPPEGKRIRATGRVVWYDELGSREESYYFRAGVVLKEMETGDRIKWLDFASNIA
jgi:hypothetical protein